MNRKQLDLEDQVRVGRNLGQCALTAVPQRGRNPQLPLATDHHESDSFVPARNDLADVELEGKGLAAHATVKLRTIIPVPFAVPPPSSVDLVVRSQSQQQDRFCALMLDVLENNPKVVPGTTCPTPSERPAQLMGPQGWVR